MSNSCKLIFEKNRLIDKKYDKKRLHCVIMVLKSFKKGGAKP